MRSHPASAVFDTRAEAERAVADLRAAGAPDGAVPAAARDRRAAMRTVGDGAATGEGRGGVLGAALALLFRNDGQGSTRSRGLRR